jgi:hypothetical protein
VADESVVTGFGNMLGLYGRAPSAPDSDLPLSMIERKPDTDFFRVPSCDS